MAYTSTLQKLSESLTTTYKNTIFTQVGDIGDSREKEVINYLNKVMAHKYGFSSGEIFDEEDKMSGQVDVVIYDNLFSTVFTDGSGKILAPVESTYGIISVKSKMGVKELDNAIEGIKTFDCLKRPQAKDNVFYVTPDFPIEAGENMEIEKSSRQKNINCIFAFDTTIALETIKQKMKDSDCVDLLVVPGKFCAFGRFRPELGLRRQDNNDELSNIIVSTNKSVSLFTMVLQLYLSKNNLIARDVTDLVLWVIHQGKMLV